MNPDPFAPVDPDTPFRIDHLLHLVASVVLCVMAIAGVTGAILIYWRLHSPEMYEERFATLPGSCVGGSGHTFRGRSSASAAVCLPPSRSPAAPTKENMSRLRAGSIQSYWEQTYPAQLCG